jgi:hypothetical protein
MEERQQRDRTNRQLQLRRRKRLTDASKPSSTG